MVEVGMDANQVDMTLDAIDSNEDEPPAGQVWCYRAFCPCPTDQQDGSATCCGKRELRNRCWSKKDLFHEVVHHLKDGGHHAGKYSDGEIVVHANTVVVDEPQECFERWPIDKKYFDEHMKHAEATKKNKRKRPSEAKREAASEPSSGSGGTGAMQAALQQMTTLAAAMAKKFDEQPPGNRGGDGDRRDRDRHGDAGDLGGGILVPVGRGGRGRDRDGFDPDDIDEFVQCLRAGRSQMSRMEQVAIACSTAFSVRPENKLSQSSVFSIVFQVQHFHASEKMCFKTLCFLD